MDCTYTVSTSLQKLLSHSGWGYELVSGEHLLQPLGLMFCCRLTDHLNLCVSPGAIFEDAEVFWSGHFEGTYEFEVCGVHMGPTLGFPYNAEDIHISLGFHKNCHSRRFNG